MCIDVEYFINTIIASRRTNLTVPNNLCNLRVLGSITILLCGPKKIIIVGLNFQFSLNFIKFKLN